MSRLVWAIAALSSAALGCELIAGLDDKTIAEGAGGQAAGGSGPGGNGASGGTGNTGAGGAGADGGTGGAGGAGGTGAVGPCGLPLPPDPCTRQPTEGCECGTTGKSCQGGECQSGTCKPVTIATCIEDARGLQVNDYGVFWTAKDGALYRADHFAEDGEYERLDLHTDPIFEAWRLDVDCSRAFFTSNGYGVGYVDITQGLAVKPPIDFIAAVGGTHGRGIVIDGDDVFFALGGIVDPPEGSIERWTLDAVATEAVAPDTGNTFDIAVDDTHVYFSSGEGGDQPLDPVILRRVLKNATDGQVEDVTDVPGFQIALDEEHVYFTDEPATGVYRVNKGVGQTPQEVTMGQGERSLTVALDDEYFYFAGPPEALTPDNVGISRRRKDLSSPPEPLLLPAPRDVFDMKIYGQTLYILNNLQSGDACMGANERRSVQRFALPPPP